MKTTRINKFQTGLLIILAGCVITATVVLANQSEQQAQPEQGTNVAKLLDYSVELKKRADARRTPLYYELLTRKSGPAAALNNDPDIMLMGIDNGRPVYYETHNSDAAMTIGVPPVWPGGSLGLNLTGTNAVGQLALWDGGRVMETHQEFGGRVVSRDGMPDVHYHATHVGGTMIAAGINPESIGMSYTANLDSYDWSDDESEMATAAAAGLLVSNHSYGSVTGWSWRSTEEVWRWYGEPSVSETEDPGFGIYYYSSSEWDQISFDAPYYLIVKSAGNDRNDAGPGVDGEHYIWDGDVNDWVLSTVTREADGGEDGFDSISFKGNSKNILTVGAVEDIDAGWTQASEVVASSFTGWGPTDDGRIKPDVVGNGVSLSSCYTDSNDSYARLSGTSMSAPNVSGATNLLTQYWRNTHSGFNARSATIKGLLIHTTNEAGPANGPDYMFGWGLVNTAAAAEAITADVNYSSRIIEATLMPANTGTYLHYSDGSEPITATLCWTDPAGVSAGYVLNDTNPVLVNDLDLRIERVSDSQVFMPWILDPLNPAVAATTGDNVLDNVEKVQIAAPAAGTYRVLVTHKGSLTNFHQDYSVLVSGLGAMVQGPSVDNVTFSQRTDGSGLVDVTYDVSDADSAELTVTLEASSDGGVTWDLVVSTVSGDIGGSVAPGIGNSILWDFASDNPGVFHANVVVRVTTSDD